MSVKPCARAECGKSVSPMEELKCLDQVWHKQCFRCSVCSMVLNMKNYKGYNKMPYCKAHYPKTTATVVSDTPEMRRLQEATKNQSLEKTIAEICQELSIDRRFVTDDNIGNLSKLAADVKNVRKEAASQIPISPPLMVASPETGLFKRFLNIFMGTITLISLFFFVFYAFIYPTAMIPWICIFISIMAGIHYWKMGIVSVWHMKHSLKIFTILLPMMPS